MRGGGGVNFLLSKLLQKTDGSFIGETWVCYIDRVHHDTAHRKRRIT